MPERAAPPTFIRPGFPPAIVAVIVLLAGLALLDSTLFIAVRFLASICAAVMIVYAVQGRVWVWLIPLTVLVVVWNPVFPIELPSDVRAPAQLLGCGFFLAVGLFMKTRDRLAR